MKILMRRLVVWAIAPTLAGIVLAAGVLHGAPDAADRREYRKRADKMDQAHFSARLALALWCIDKQLLNEAEVQLDCAAGIDPASDELMAAWRRLAEKMPRPRVAIRLTLDDGSLILGGCSPMPFLIKHEKGVLLVRLDELKGLDLVKLGKTPVVAVQVPQGRFQGTLLAPPLEVKTPVGELSVPLEMIRKFAIEKEDAPKAETPPAPGEVALNWDKHLARLNAHGLDIVFVFDSTGSMGGVILQVKTRIRELIRVVTTLVPDARLGLVTYRDHKEYDLDDYQFTVKHLPLQKADEDGLQKLQSFLRETEAYGGGDVPEAVCEGVKTAIQKCSWNRRAVKVIIVFGDAPPRKERARLTTLHNYCKRWKTGGGILSCIDVGGGKRILPEFRQMASLGGGEATFLDDEKAIIKQLVVYIFGSRWKSEIEKVYGPGGRR